MSYILAGTTIKAPQKMAVANSTQHAQQRTLAGTVNRDFFGANKRTWTMSYSNMTQTDYSTINSIYQTYLSTGSTQTFQSTETNNTITSTNVHIDLVQRDFSTQGLDYISDFTLTLTEA